MVDPRGRSGWWQSLRCAVAALAVASSGCEVDATQLLAVVNTDLAVPAEVDGVRLRVWSEGEAEPRLDRTILPAEPDEALPASFGIAPRGRDATRRITATADALLAGGTVVTTSAATTFLEHQALRLDLYLARGCRGVVCDDGETCRAGACEPVDLDPDRLPIFVTGQDLGPPPPDEPPPPEGATVLLPVQAGTILTDLHLALAPDGAAVITGTFRGGITFIGAQVGAPDFENGFVARYDPDGTPRYEQVVSADTFDAGVEAVAVTGEDVTWIATGCTGGVQVFRPVDGLAVSSVPCASPRRLDRPLDPDGATDPAAALSWSTDLPLEELAAMSAQADSVGTFLYQPGDVRPFIGHWEDRGPQASCQIDAAIVPAAVQLEDTGEMWIAGSFEGAIANLGIASAGVGRDAFVGLMHDFSFCADADFESAGGPADEEVLGLAVSAGAWVVTGRSDGEGFVRDAAGNVGALRGDGADVITDIVQKEDEWIVSGTSGANATYDTGASNDLPSLGARDARILGLADDLALLWQVALGGSGDDEAAGVRIDETRGELVLLGTTTGPSALDPEGILADGERAIFLHRFAPP